MARPKRGAASWFQALLRGCPGRAERVRATHVTPGRHRGFRTVGMEVSDARRLKKLEDETRRLKSVIADLTLDSQALKAVLGERW
jgi:hypothetical protein